jgi:hypothetical protein
VEAVSAALMTALSQAMMGFAFMIFHHRDTEDTEKEKKGFASKDKKSSSLCALCASVVDFLLF